MSKDVRRSKAVGGGELPSGCGFEALPVYDGNTNAPAGWRVRRVGAELAWLAAPHFTHWEDVLSHIGGAK